MISFKCQFQCIFHCEVSYEMWIIVKNFTGFFFIAGKFCPSCGKQIFHDKFKVSAELQEARWAHKQARQRELAEVVDFLEWHL